MARYKNPYTKYGSKRRRQVKRRRRKAKGMKVAHKNMLKGAGALFALLVFAPQLPIGWASKVQGIFGGQK